MDDTTPSQLISGWDIGIKNLSYCNLRLSQNGDDVNNVFSIGDKSIYISKWDVINIVNRLEANLITNNKIILSRLPLLKCSYVKRSKNLEYCGKPANFSLLTKTDDDKYMGVCKKHKIKYEEHNKLKIPEIKTKPICYVDECKTVAKYVDKNHYYLSYCKKHIQSKNDYIEIGKSTKTMNINLTVIGKALYETLDDNPELLEVDKILLENQPVLTNPTMKSIQMLLYSYFLIRGVHDDDKIKEIKCFSASKKTNIVHMLDIDTKTKILEEMKTIKNKYTRNKKMSIAIVKDLLKDKARWFDFFNSHKKKDDLADAFLMTLYYIVNN